VFSRGVCCLRCVQRLVGVWAPRRVARPCLWSVCVAARRAASGRSLHGWSRRVGGRACQLGGVYHQRGENTKKGFYTQMGLRCPKLISTIKMQRYTKLHAYQNVCRLAVITTKMKRSMHALSVLSRLYIHKFVICYILQCYRICQ